jgi:hypothetical protein
MGSSLEIMFLKEKYVQLRENQDTKIIQMMLKGSSGHYEGCRTSHQV